MQDFNRKFANSLIEADDLWERADHLVNIIFPVVRDPKLLIKALEALYKCVSDVISAILKFEYVYRGIELSEDSNENLKIFFNKCMRRYINEERALREIIDLGRKHQDSGFEFSKKEKFVIFDEFPIEISREKMKSYLETIRKLLNSTHRNFSVNFQKGI